MNIISLPTSGDDVWKIMALMLYPDNKKEQSNWIDQARHWNLIERKKGGLISDNVIDNLSSDYWFRANDFSAESKVTREADTHAKKGIIVGDILLHIYLMEKAGIEEPSIRKASFIVRSKAYKTKDGKSRKYTKTEVSIMWSKLRGVAHLWAALRLNDHYNFVDGIFSSADNMKMFLSMARTFQEFSTTFIPFRAKQPLLPLDLPYRVSADIEGSGFDDKSNKGFYENKLKDYNSSID